MPLVDHLSVGVSDIAEAQGFYDPVLETVGCPCLASGEGFATYGEGRIEFLLLLPFDGNPCSGGNGTHIGFSAPSQAAVRAFYGKALELGGTDEGAPGIRDAYPMPDVFSAYVRDPFGNKLEVIHNGFSVSR
ncbi:MAG: VOC family protein [Pseudomonadota bacterium]